MTIINRLVRLHIGVKIISDKYYILSHCCSVQALPHHLHDKPHPPVDSLQVLICENRFDRIRGERSVQSGCQADWARLVGEQHGDGGLADDTALDMDRSGVRWIMTRNIPDTEGQGWTSRHDQSDQNLSHGPGGQERCHSQTV